MGFAIHKLADETNTQGGVVNTSWLVLIIGGLLNNALADEINDQGGLLSKGGLTK
jgi:hypothetical protein